jgi:hypothetical protein
MQGQKIAMAKAQKNGWVLCYLQTTSSIAMIWYKELHWCYQYVLTLEKMPWVF